MPQTPSFRDTFPDYPTEAEIELQEWRHRQRESFFKTLSATRNPRPPKDLDPELQEWMQRQRDSFTRTLSETQTP